MPFGESMISTLKSNTSIMLNQSKRFRKTIGGNNKQRQSTGNLPNAIPQQLKEIRERIKREKKLLWIKVMMLSVLIIGILVWMIYTS